MAHRGIYGLSLHRIHLGGAGSFRAESVHRHYLLGDLGLLLSFVLNLQRLAEVEDNRIVHIDAGRIEDLSDGYLGMNRGQHHPGRRIDRRRSPHGLYIHALFEEIPRKHPIGILLFPSFPTATTWLR